MFITNFFGNSGSLPLSKTNFEFPSGGSPRLGPWAIPASSDSNDRATPPAVFMKARLTTRQRFRRFSKRDKNRWVVSSTRARAARAPIRRLFSTLTVDSSRHACNKPRWNHLYATSVRSRYFAPLSTGAPACSMHRSPWRWRSAVPASGRHSAATLPRPGRKPL